MTYLKCCRQSRKDTPLHKQTYYCYLVGHSVRNNGNSILIQFMKIRKDQKRSEKIRKDQKRSESGLKFSLIDANIRGDNTFSKCEI